MPGTIAPSCVCPSKRHAIRTLHAMHWLAVHGTHGNPHDPADWSHEDGVLATEFAAADIHLLDRGDRWFWSGDLDGLPIDRCKDWLAAARSLVAYLKPIPYADRNLVAHSHGGAVALLAAEHVAQRVLITVGTPPRKEVRAVAARVLDAGGLGSWLHVYDAIDWIRALGGMFDGQCRLSGAFRLPGMMESPIRGISHTRALYAPQYAAVRQNWIAWIRDARVGKGHVV